MRQGISQVQGSERKLPPDNQFSQIINVNEYDSAYVAESSMSTLPGKKSRVSAHKPKYMRQET